MNPHWKRHVSLFSQDILRIVTAILDAKDDSFVKLGEIAKLDPATAYIGADLTDCDFGNDDLAGFNFTNADVSRANFSQVRNFDLVILTNATTTDTIWPST